jgi:hypothetical protein
MKQRLDVFAFSGIAVPPGAGQERHRDLRPSDEKVADAGSEHAGGSCD